MDRVLVSDKECKKCNKIKPLTEFHRHPRASGGHINYCKECKHSDRKVHYHNNIKEIKTKLRAYYENNTETIKSKVALRREQFPEKVKMETIKYREANRSKIRARTKMRKQRIIQATPSWADYRSLLEFYINCPKDHHVDHVIPLKGKNVSGLHIIENLQYLPAAENIKKSNKF